MERHSFMACHGFCVSFFICVRQRQFVTICVYQDIMAIVPAKPLETCLEDAIENKKLNLLARPLLHAGLACISCGETRNGTVGITLFNHPVVYTEYTASVSDIGEIATSCDICPQCITRRSDYKGMLFMKRACAETTCIFQLRKPRNIENEIRKDFFKDVSHGSGFRCIGRKRSVSFVAGHGCSRFCIR